MRQYLLLVLLGLITLHNFYKSINTTGNAESQLGTYKYVIDAVGNSKTSKLKEKSKKSLTPDGKYISIDHGTPLTPKDAFLRLKTLAEQESIKAVIDCIYPLEEMAEAHKYVEKGHKRDNVVISVKMDRYILHV